MRTELKAFLASRKKANLVMVLLNILVFLVLSFLGKPSNASFMLAHGASFTPSVLDGEYYRLITAMFLHFSLQHLLYNMLCLLFLGDVLEHEVGTVKYLLVYFLGGIAGNLLSMFMEIQLGRGYAVSAGASGAIFAVIGAVLWIVIRRKGKLGSISLQRMALMTALMVAEGFTEGGIDNAAHIGGLIAGFVLSMILYRKRQR